jgi:hypothetical protein
MSQFFWVEDFEGTTPKDTTQRVFGSLWQHPSTKVPEAEEDIKDFLEHQGVFLETTFLRAWEFIHHPQKLFRIDYIILDIDLVPGKLANAVLSDILAQWYDYQATPQDLLQDTENRNKAAKALKKVAGYQLYVELVMNLGFPQDHILFCSNHGEEMKNIQAAFITAKMQLPQILTKNQTKELADWIKVRRGNAYTVLRRGIIEGGVHISQLISKHPEYIQFGEFIQTDNGSPMREVTVKDLQEYLESLQHFLPLRQPDNPQQLYKLFIRNLAHEWDAAYPDNLPRCDKGDKNCHQVRTVKYTFGWIMKHARNWAAHTTQLDNLSTPEVAFLFIVAMRAMFKLSDTPERYETLLLELFNKTATGAMPDIIGTASMNTKLPLSRTYLAVKNQIFQSHTADALHFHQLLNNLNNNQVEFDYVTGLFQMFWHGLSPVRLYERGTTIDRNQNVVFTYSFWLNDYGKADNGFLFELARSIYQRSFI